MKRFVITLAGGLGNRLRGLATALLVAERHEAELLVYWSTGNGRQTACGTDGFHANFAELYEVPASCHLIEVAERDRLNDLATDRWSLTRQDQEPITLTHDLSYAHVHGPLRQHQIPDDAYRTVLRAFKPVPAVLPILTRIKADLPAAYTGLLARCRGTPTSRRWNAVKHFQNLARVVRGPAYLCCDTVAATWQIASFFGPRLHSCTKDNKINTRDALLTVIAEMQVLAEAQQFYGTPNCALACCIADLRADGQLLLPP
jgi:hypothetical protein